MVFYPNNQICDGKLSGRQGECHCPVSSTPRPFSLCPMPAHTLSSYSKFEPLTGVLRHTTRAPAIPTTLQERVSHIRGRRRRLSETMGRAHSCNEEMEWSHRWWREGLFRAVSGTPGKQDRTRHQNVHEPVMDHSRIGRQLPVFDMSPSIT
ncbi:hypothetical protein BC629DRAFT_638178 [Irpex lacteus]|nr:hypothetical protein BC629DRAFT_638178 [Irpex lacteus]